MSEPDGLPYPRAFFEPAIAHLQSYARLCDAIERHDATCRRCAFQAEKGPWGIFRCDEGRTLQGALRRAKLAMGTWQDRLVDAIKGFQDEMAMVDTDRLNFCLGSRSSTTDPSKRKP